MFKSKTNQPSTGDKTSLHVSLYGLQRIKSVVPKTALRIISDESKILKQEGSRKKACCQGEGAIINYNNDIKINWRSQLSDFIVANTIKEERDTMKVLCLPGIECLEIPMYLNLGFKPENIIGVESGIIKGKVDPDALRRFVMNAEKFGIQYRIGNLDDVLAAENTVFSVVSLDFLGPVSMGNSQIISKLNVGDRLILMTNYQGRRERFHKILNGKIEGSAELSQADKEKFPTTTKAFREDGFGSKLNLSALRHANISPSERTADIYKRMNTLFTIKTIQKLLSYHDLPISGKNVQDRLGNIRKIKEHIKKDVLSGISTIIDTSLSGQIAEMIKNISEIMLGVILHPEYCIDEEKKLQYTSETNTPMITYCYSCHLLEDEVFSAGKDFVEFLYTLISGYVLKMSGDIKSLGGTYLDINGRKPARRNGIICGDILSVNLDDRVYQFDVEKIFKDINTLISIIGKNLFIQ